MKTMRFALLGLACLGLGCSRLEEVLDRPRDLTPHERYLESLVQAGLDRTALGTNWVEASRRALDDALSIEPPYEESGYFLAERPTATGYRVSLTRGQALRVSLEVQSAPAPQIFIDLFRRVSSVAGEEAEYRLLASADSAASTFEFEPARDGEYLLRLQPELLRSVQYSMVVQRVATLAFPVFERDSRAIRSVFGADRDGGRRGHHGVDIFAPRGTPALAAADGEVTRVSVGARGGNYVWLRDTKRGHRFYYAHLDLQLVRRGQRVRAGDTIGLVGNSGNARTTPPHLHFGLYRRGEGPIDPYAFIHQPPSEAPRLRVGAEPLGSWVRTVEDGELRVSPNTRATPLDTLRRHTLVRLVGATGRWYRVVLPDGRPGYVAGSLVEGLDEPTEREVVRAPRPVLETPSTRAVQLAVLAPGEEVEVLGRFEAYVLVRERSGRSGWVRAAEEPQPGSR